jgi:hypothetical protein
MIVAIFYFVFTFMIQVKMTEKSMQKNCFTYVLQQKLIYLHIKNHMY